MRNFATCYSLGQRSVCEFSRRSARRLSEKSLKINDRTFSELERARLLSTRGYGAPILHDEVELFLRESRIVDDWMSKLLEEVTNYG